jgi:hypothetical protein
MLGVIRAAAVSKDTPVRGVEFSAHCPRCAGTRRAAAPRTQGGELCAPPTHPAPVCLAPEAGVRGACDRPPHAGQKP